MFCDISLRRIQLRIEWVYGIFRHCWNMATQDNYIRAELMRLKWGFPTYVGKHPLRVCTSDVRRKYVTIHGIH